MTRREHIKTFLPEQVPVSVAFAAMNHFLALHFNEVGGSAEVADFIQSIGHSENGLPISELTFDRFKEAVIDADRMEMVDGLRVRN